MSMNKVQELQEKYSLFPNSYYIGRDPWENPEEQDITRCESFQNKWLAHTEKGWYGPLGLGLPTPTNVYLALDEFLDYIIQNKNDIKILQLKRKFGSLRIYLSNLNEEIRQEVWEFEQLCFERKLIY